MYPFLISFYTNAQCTVHRIKKVTHRHYKKFYAEIIRKYSVQWTVMEAELYPRKNSWISWKQCLEILMQRRYFLKGIPLQRWQWPINNCTLEALIWSIVWNFLLLEGIFCMFSCSLNTRASHFCIEITDD